MALPKNNQVKFRIDDHTKMAFKRVLENKKITIQSIMETLLIEYIIKNIDSFCTSQEKVDNLCKKEGD